MRIPEPLFVVINAGMRLLLRSPLHGLVSRSLMLITFTGRVTGRTYTTPVRYIRVGTTIRWFTNRDAKWWPNLKHDPTVVLRLAGRDVIKADGEVREEVFVGALLCGRSGSHIKR